jgi:hypothetical protein
MIEDIRRLGWKFSAIILFKISHLDFPVVPIEVLPEK